MGELGNVTRDSIKEQEVSFIKTCKERAEANGGKLKYVDINKNAKEIEVKSIKTLSATIEGLKEKYPGLVHWRVPVCNSGAPLETDFDIMVSTLVGTAINTPIIVNNKDALFRGEFEVIKELVADLGADGEGSKRECDKVIDKNGPAKTGGTGIKQLRENIAESKLSYEIMDDAA